MVIVCSRQDMCREMEEINWHFVRVAASLRGNKKERIDENDVVFHHNANVIYQLLSFAY